MSANRSLAILGWFQLRGTTGGTTDECEAALGGTHQGISPRVNELTASGRLEKNGESRRTRSSKLAAVYVFRSSDAPILIPHRQKTQDQRLLEASKHYLRARHSARTETQVKNAVVRLLQVLNKEAKL